MKSLRMMGAIAVVVIGCTSMAAAGPYIVPDAELVLGDFTQQRFSSSLSTLDGKLDIDGPGVQFILTLRPPDYGKIGIGDPWPTNPAAEFGFDPVLGHWTSLVAYDKYQMRIQYVDGPARSDVDLALFMNTGLTGASGYPPNDWTNDTFWQGNWVNLRVGHSALLELDFNAAQAWNITDNKVPHTGGGLGLVNGAVYAINQRDRNEVSGIGLQVADFDGDAVGAQIRVNLNAVPPGPKAQEYLYEKDPIYWRVVPDGAWGLLEYNLWGPTFDSIFDGDGLEPGQEYTLIYYPDPWPGKGLIRLASGVTDQSGCLHIEGSVATGDLPAPYDANHPYGAKIWLVLSSDIGGDQMVGWQPTRYLFESDRITFDSVAAAAKRSVPRKPGK